MRSLLTHHSYIKLFYTLWSIEWSYGGVLGDEIVASNKV